MVPCSFSPGGRLYGAEGIRHQTATGNNSADFIPDGTVNRTYLYGDRGPEYKRTGTEDPG